ncbi:DUF3405 domain-containing protein [Aspergillus foveolatus]|uniref:DUF3405 domain-containing protein n=1 Tax=Aspergillus foveolatus TaxID=210207 RepID=UPI003CCE0182
MFFSSLAGLSFLFSPIENHAQQRIYYESRLSVVSRRYIFLTCLSSTLLLLFLTLSLPIRPQRISFLSNSGLHFELDVLRPDDFTGRLRQLKPSDDQIPPAHEPIGPGTLRDVRYMSCTRYSQEHFFRGGLSTVMLDGASRPGPAVYDPYPDYNDEVWTSSGKGMFHACEGPRGRTLNQRNHEDMVLAYPGIQRDFPVPIFGSYDAFGLDGNTCTTRFSRLSAYGYGDFGTDAAPVRWGLLQAQCPQRNLRRYTATDEHPMDHILPLRPMTAPPSGKDDGMSPHNEQRAANMKQQVRLLVMEHSLHSGGEYEVFLLTHVKDNEISLYTAEGDSNAQCLKEKFIPREFWDMTVFFSEETLKAWYPNVEEHRPSHQHLQPIQIFSALYPQFDYIWQLEMDSRLTGHFYHFLERAGSFAKKQPRKYLWERNAYFHIPGAQDTWDSFIKTTDQSMTGKPTIWGSAAPSNSWIQTPYGPTPPVARSEDDNYAWGTGEEADLITFLPFFDPTETNWFFSDVLWDFPAGTPRRASPVTMGRYSKLLLKAIHDAQTTEDVAIVSEMTAPTFALWHGLKAVHVPHPVYVDGKWASKELDRIVNKGDPERINGGSDSVWNWDHKFDHILYRMSYMFTAQAAEDLYRRWLGYEVDRNQYTDGSIHQDPQGRNWFDGGDLREDIYGPLCFPPMFLHPVKNTAVKKGPDMAVPV